jgi:hypothetical protein
MPGLYTASASRLNTPKRADYLWEIVRGAIDVPVLSLTRINKLEAPFGIGAHPKCSGPCDIYW